MKTGNTAQILEIEGFLDRVECRNVVMNLENSDSWVSDPSPDGAEKNRILGYSDKFSHFAHSSICDAFKRVKPQICSFYGDDFFIGRPAMRSWGPGENLGLHCDDRSHDTGKLDYAGEGQREGGVIPPALRSLSALIYLNEGFSGGTFCSRG